MNSTAAAPEPGSSEEHPGRLDTAERTRIMLDGVVNYSGSLVGRLAGLVLVPALLHAFGVAGYGLWVSAFATASVIFAILDPGLGWVIAAEVAADRNAPQASTPRLVRTAGGLNALLAVAGIALTAAAGGLSARVMRLTMDRPAVLLLFVLVGSSCAADYLLTVPYAVLLGLRRFGFLNAASAIATLIRCVVAVLLARRPNPVIAIAAWYVIVSTATWLAQVMFVQRADARYALALKGLDWRLLREKMRFGVASQITMAAGTIFWQSPVLLLGNIAGTAAAASYDVAQRFPLAMAQVSGRMAQVLFPAAREGSGDAGRERARQVLYLGVRWLALITLPLALLLIVLAPSLLRLWVGSADAAMVMVLRILACAMLVDGVATGAVEVLWARQRMAGLLGFILAAVAVNATLVFWLAPRFGIRAAAWSFAAAVTITAFLVVRLALRECGGTWRALATGTLPMLLFSGGMLLAVLLSLQAAVPASDGLRVALFGLVGAGVYLACIAVSGVRTEEKALLARFLPAAWRSKLYTRPAL